MKSLFRIGLAASLTVGASMLSAGCEEYKPVVSVQVANVVGNSIDQKHLSQLDLIFSDPTQSNPNFGIDLSTLHLKIFPADDFATDPSGTGDSLSPIYEFDGSQDHHDSGLIGGTGNLSDDSVTFAIKWKDPKTLPGSVPLVAVVLPGLADLDGRLTRSPRPIVPEPFTYPLQPCVAGVPIVDAQKPARQLGGRHVIGFHAALSKPSTYSFGMMVDMWIDENASTTPNVIVNLFGVKPNNDPKHNAGCSSSCPSGNVCVLKECQPDHQNMLHPEWFPDYTWDPNTLTGGRVVVYGCAYKNPKADGNAITLAMEQQVYAAESTPAIEVTGVTMSGVLLPRKKDDGSYDFEALDGKGTQNIVGGVKLSGAQLGPGGGVLTFVGFHPGDDGPSPDNQQHLPPVTDAEKKLLTDCQQHPDNESSCVPCKNSTLRALPFQTAPVCKGI